VTWKFGNSSFKTKRPTHQRGNPPPLPQHYYFYCHHHHRRYQFHQFHKMAVPDAQPNRQPDFIRYYLQFPAVTRTFLTLIFLTSVSIQLGFINRYSLYSSLWGSFLRFFDAGWGIWFLMTLVMSISSPPSRLRLCV
jgi:hypothetical protein